VDEREFASEIVTFRRMVSRISRHVWGSWYTPPTTKNRTEWATAWVSLQSQRDRCTRCSIPAVLDEGWEA